MGYWNFLEIFLNFYLLLTESTHVSGKGAERGGQRIRSSLHAVSAKPRVGLEPINHEIMT